MERCFLVEANIRFFSQLTWTNVHIAKLQKAGKTSTSAASITITLELSSDDPSTNIFLFDLYDYFGTGKENVFP